MSRAEVESIHERERAYCAGGAGRPRQRRFAEVPAEDVRRFWVEPSGGSDAAPGTRDQPFRTLTRALREVPMVPGGTVPTGEPAISYEINLLPGAYRIVNEAAAADPAAGVVWASGEPTMLRLDQRRGTARHPIVVQGDPVAIVQDAPGGSPPLPVLHFRLSLRNVQHLYLKNFRIEISDDVWSREGTHDAGGLVPHALHCQTIPPWDTRIPTPRLDTHHVLMKGLQVDGGSRGTGRTGMIGTVRSGEVVKVNQCRSIFIEDCDLRGAGTQNGNCVDFLAVQFGHVVGCDMRDCNDWVAYAKGGSAYIRFAENRIHFAPLGIGAGEGTDCESLTEPWWHYEAYAVQIVDNLIYDVEGTALGVQGGYDSVIAYNTVYNSGTRGQVIRLEIGQRSCRRHSDSTDTSMYCQTAVDRRAWATTGTTRVSIVPNRHTWICNNVILVDSASAPFDLVDANETALSASTSRELNAPSGSAIEALVMEGNFAWVVGTTATASVTGFETSFPMNNRVDRDPGLNVDRNDRANFLRPLSASSSVVREPLRTAQISAPPPSWATEIPATVDAPWATEHTDYLDFDRDCRGAGTTPGARSTPVGRALTVERVAAPDINTIFSPTPSIVVGDSTAPITLAGTTGQGFLQSRLFTPGAPGREGAGLFAYLYRIHLLGMSGGGSVSALTVEFGPIERASFAAGRPPADVFVVATGGMGSVAPSAVVQTRDQVTFRFDTPVRAGESSYFFGLCSRAPARHAGGSLGVPGPVSIDTRVPYRPS